MVHLLLDNGAGRIKYGVSSVDKTSRSASNCLAKINKQMQVLVADQIDNTQNGSALHYIRPFERGYLTNMSAQIEIWDRVFNKLLSAYPGQSNNNSSSSQKSAPRLDPKETSLVLTEPAFAPIPLQNDLNEVIFEHYSFKEYTRKPASYFSAYHFSQLPPEGTINPQCVTVIDSGFSFSHVCPYIDNKCVKNAVKRVNVGGKLLTNYLKEIVSYRQWNMMDEFFLVNHVKEELCYVSKDFNRELALSHLAAQNQRENLKRKKKDRREEVKVYDYKGENLQKSYILPDFQNIMKGRVKEDEEKLTMNEQVLAMETERYTVPEVLFHPSDVGMQQAGLVEATHQSLSEVISEVDRGLLSRNILLTGGNMCFPQVKERFETDIRSLIPTHFDSHVYCPDQPADYAWQGMDLWVQNCSADNTISSHMLTKANYEDYGHDYLNEKFFRLW